MIKLERSHLCVKFLHGRLRVGRRTASGREEGRKKNLTFSCVVENVGGGVRSHPAVINLLAVRCTEIEVEM